MSIWDKYYHPGDPKNDLIAVSQAARRRWNEDIAQEAVTKFLESEAKCDSGPERGKSSLKSFIFKIAENLEIDGWRKGQTHKKYEGALSAHFDALAPSREPVVHKGYEQERAAIIEHFEQTFPADILLKFEKWLERSEAKGAFQAVVCELMEMWEVLESRAYEVLAQLREGLRGYARINEFVSSFRDRALLPSS